MDTVQSAKEHHFDNGLVLNSHEARISRPEMMAALLRNSTGELPQMKAAGSASQAKAQRRGAMLRIRLCKICLQKLGGQGTRPGCKLAGAFRSRLKKATLHVTGSMQTHGRRLQRMLCPAPCRSWHCQACGKEGQKNSNMAPRKKPALQDKHLKPQKLEPAQAYCKRLSSGGGAKGNGRAGSSKRLQICESDFRKNNTKWQKQ